MRLINADALIEKCGEWYLEEGTETGFIGTLKSLIDEQPTIDAVPIGCLELEKRDCSFADACDMGSSYGRERERACKNIIEWYKTPNYQRCLEVAEQRGFIKER